MRRLVKDIVSQPLLLTLFIVLLTALFLGDKPQSIIDIVSAGGTLALFAVAHFFTVRQRVVTTRMVIVWITFLLYLVTRTIMSDDVGSSTYISVRWIELYLVFYVFYCYGTAKMINIIQRGIVGFSLVSLFISIIYAVFPVLIDTLPLTNLLVPEYGHNHIIDILLFGYPIALFWYIDKQSWKILCIVGLFLFGILFSFARAGLVLTAILSYVAIIVQQNRLIKKTKILLLIISIPFLIGLTAVFVLPKEYLKNITKTNSEFSAYKQNILLDDARLEYWRQVTVAIKERPFFGSGAGTFILQSIRLQKTSLSSSTYAHNSVLEYISELGVVGLIFLVIIIAWFVKNIREYLLFHKNDNSRTMKIIISTLFVQIIYSFLDFNYAFFIIQTLFVVLLGFTAIFCSKQQKTIQPSFSRVVLIGCIAIVLVFYCYEIICVTGKLKHPPLSYCCLLSSMSTMNTITERNRTNTKMSKTEQQLTYFLHRRNPKILIVLAENIANGDLLQSEEMYKKAFEANSKDATVFKKMISLLYSTNNMCKINDAIFSLESRSIEATEYTPKYIQNTINSRCVFFPKLPIPDSFDNVEKNKKYLARAYYIWGENLLHDKQYSDQTEYLWDKARKYDIDLSFYSVELAGLYYSLHKYDKATQVLQNCKQSTFAYIHCLKVETEGLDSIIPGSLYDQILNWEIK
jgi:O-antigen ligase